MNQKSLFLWGGAVVVVLAIIGILAFGGNRGSQSANNSSEKLSVVTTLFPLYDFAKAVGGDHAEVSLILPPGVEPHSFEPKPGDMVNINESDLFVYTGAEMDPWAEELRKSIRPSVAVVNTSTGMTLLESSPEARKVHQEEDGHTNEPGNIDPHIWLDFDNAAQMVTNIEQAFIARDGANAEVYRKNAQEYRAKLSALDAQYRSALQSCQTRTIIYGGHYAFGYLANRYTLNYMAAQGFAPDSEPTAQDLAQLIEQLKTNNLKYVFYEELTSPKIAQTISGETGAELLLLNAAHNIAKEDYTKGTTFIGIMEGNLENLKAGLGCQ